MNPPLVAMGGRLCIRTHRALAQSLQRAVEAWFVYYAKFVQAQNHDEILFILSSAFYLLNSRLRAIVEYHVI
jgi:hypothetical protein